MKPVTSLLARSRTTPPPSGVEVRIVDPRTDPEPTGWSRFRKTTAWQPMWDYEQLRLESWLSRNPTVLGVVSKAGSVLGACLAMVCTPWRGSEFGPPRRRGLSPGWAEVYLPWFSGHSAAVFVERVDDAQRRELLRSFERALAAHVGIGLLGVVYRAMPVEVADAAAGPGRAVREIDPTTVLVNRWESVDDWLTSLRPPMRALVAEAAETASTLDVMVGAGRTDLDAAELAGLLNRHRARQDAKAWESGQRARIAGLHLDTRSPIPTAYLDAFVRKPNVVTRTYRDGTGRLVAFSLLLDDKRGVALPYYAALPVADGGRPRLYADVYAQCVRHLVEHQRPELTAGRTLLDLKTGFGFTTRTLTSIAVPRPVMGR
ncbi:hypothetical protein [Saccharomonospora sp. NB11]|jgi:hypothetical protein|uniref:hypothetical protein n=1 Tax=Saccharomonospora sp. NB11 TaxID=1642298 RepID=UPI0018D1DEA2|nr:hypothetical protein [Saccharomonospora sp. NB11]